MIDVDRGTYADTLKSITGMIKTDVNTRLPEDSRVSVVTYQKTASTRVAMTDDMDDVATKLSEIIPCKKEFNVESCKESNLAKALLEALKQFSDDEEVMAKRIVIITDSSSLLRNHENPNSKNHRELRKNLKGVDIDVVNIGKDPTTVFDTLFKELKETDPNGYREIVPVKSSKTLSGTLLPNKVCPSSNETLKPTAMPTSHVIPVCSDCDCNFDWDKGKLDDASTCLDVPTGKCDFSYVEMKFGATSMHVPCYFDPELRACISMTNCAEPKPKTPSGDGDGSASVSALGLLSASGIGSGSGPSDQCLLLRSLRVRLKAACPEVERVTGGAGPNCFDPRCNGLYTPSCRAAARVLSDESVDGNEIVGQVVNGELLQESSANDAKSCWATCNEEDLATSYVYMVMGNKRRKKNCKCFTGGDIQSCGVVGEL